MSDYLTDEEQMARLRTWWQRNGAALAVGVVVIVAGVVGWRWYQSFSEERVMKASDLYVEYLAAGGTAQRALADEIVAGGKATAYPALVLMHQAQMDVAAGEFEVAGERLRDAIALASGRPLADLARLRQARLQHQVGRDDEALKTIAEIRAAGYVPVAQELKGDIHLARGERTLAYQAYVSALANVLAEDQQALLEIKVADTADASDS